jgi:tetratricopeptide (TPR) repeat protein
MAKSRKSRAAASARTKTSEKKPAKAARTQPPAGRTGTTSRRSGQGSPRLSPLERAQELVYKALENEDPEWQITQAQKALDICRDCADAYTILAEYAPDSAQALMLCAAAVEAALRVMDPELLQSQVGNFWGILETRPYMRARLALAQRLWTAGRRDDSLEHLADLLRLNPDDNQGVRYILAGRLLEAGRDKELEVLLKKYNEPSAFWGFSQALAAFRLEGDTPESRKLLARARKLNRHIVPLLLERHFDGLGRAPFYSAGDVNEATVYLEDFSGGWRQTPGAITWLRCAVAESKSRKRGARAAVGPTAEVKKSLLRLPQRFGTEWQASIHRLPTWVEEAGTMYRPWSILAVDYSEHLILGQEMVVERPTAATVFDQLVQTMERPAIGEPHRPSEIQVREEPLWEEIRPHLEEIGVDCIYRTELDEIAYIQDQMQQMFLAEQQVPGLVEIPGIDLPQVASFFAAADYYYRRAPWRRLPVETAIRIECERFRKHRDRPSYAVVMGQSNMTLGLALYRDLETIQELWWGESDPDLVGEFKDTCSVMFSEAFEIAMTDLLACEANHWPLGGPEAYPMVLCAKPDFDHRLPEPWEFHFLEGCLRAIPQFVERHELLVNPAAETISVPTALGNLEMTLSWEPEADSCGEDCDDCHDHCEHEH